MVYLPGVLDNHPSTPPPQQGIVAGYVSKSRPAPVSFDDPVYVIVPSHGIDTPYGPVSWPAVHGLAMPVPGSPIWLAFDGDGVPVVVWWTAAYASATAIGVAGGDLTGSYPQPTIAVGAVTDKKVAAANKDGLAGTPSMRTLGTGHQQAMAGDATPGGAPTGLAGGSLIGSYPNPGIGAAMTPLTVGGTGVAFAANWSNFGGGFPGASYWTDQIGVVHVRGVVAMATGAGSTIFTLPAGARPAGTTTIVADFNGGTSPVQVTSTGTVVFPGTVVNGAFLWLDGISFRTDV